MEYGVRRYEAAQRLRWFLFFLVCVGLAFPVTRAYLSGQAPPPSGAGPWNPEALKSTTFWVQKHWIHVEPFGKAVVYCVWVAILFLGGRLIGLVAQYAGQFALKGLLVTIMQQTPASARIAFTPSASKVGRFLPTEILLTRVSPLHLQLVLHAFRRLRLLLAHPNGAHSSKDLLEKERRIAETDWEVLWASWSPFRWLLWLLPFLALVQVCWLITLQLQPALSGQQDLQELVGPLITSLVPLAQIIGLTFAFTLAAGLLKRMEGLYLSSVDALLYDQFLSLLPFQSSDTVIILEALDKHFREVHAVLKRLESVLSRDRGHNREPADMGIPRG